MKEGSHRPRTRPSYPDGDSEGDRTGTDRRYRKSLPEPRGPTWRRRWSVGGLTRDFLGPRPGHRQSSRSTPSKASARPRLGLGRPRPTVLRLRVPYVGPLLDTGVHGSSSRSHQSQESLVRHRPPRSSPPNPSCEILPVELWTLPTIVLPPYPPRHLTSTCTSCHAPRVPTPCH